MQRTVHSLGLLMKSCASVVMIASSRRRSARTADTAVLDAALEADPEFIDPPTSSAAVAAVGVGAHVPGVSACPV